MSDQERRPNNLERRFPDTFELTRGQMEPWARLLGGGHNGEEPTEFGWKAAEWFITECRARGWEISFVSLTRLESEGV